MKSHPGSQGFNGFLGKAYYNIGEIFESDGILSNSVTETSRDEGLLLLARYPLLF
jgi:hypothetical protein